MSATAKGRLDLSGLLGKKSLSEVEAESKRDRVLMLHPDEIEAPKQVRKVFKDIEGLRASIDASGQKQPIVVGPKNAKGKYPLLLGGRRLCAAKIEPVILLKAILDVDSGSVPKASAILAQIAENEQRAPLLPHELGRAIRDAQEEAKAEGGKLTGREIAASLGKREEYISLHLAIADIPESLEALIVSGASKDVTVLNNMRTLFEKDPELYEEILADAMEKKELARYTVREALKRAKGSPDTPPATDPIPAKPQVDGAAPQAAPAPTVVVSTNDESANEAGGKTAPTPGAGVQVDAAKQEGGAPNLPAGSQVNDEKLVHAQTFGGAPQKTQVNDAAVLEMSKSAAKHFVEAKPDELIIFVRVTFEEDIRTGKLVTKGVCDDSSKMYVTVVDGAGNTTTELVHADDIQIVSISKRS
jgi:ParB family chromosome partitioning protein